MSLTLFKLQLLATLIFILFLAFVAGLIFFLLIVWMGSSFLYWISPIFPWNLMARFAMWWVRRRLTHLHQPKDRRERRKKSTWKKRVEADVQAHGNRVRTFVLLILLVNVLLPFATLPVLAPIGNLTSVMTAVTCLAVCLFGLNVLFFCLLVLEMVSGSARLRSQILKKYKKAPRKKPRRAPEQRHVLLDASITGGSGLYNAASSGFQYGVNGVTGFFQALARSA